MPYHPLVAVSIVLQTVIYRISPSRTDITLWTWRQLNLSLGLNHHYASSRAVPHISPLTPACPLGPRLVGVSGDICGSTREEDLIVSTSRG